MQMEVVMWRALQREFCLSRGWAKNSNCLIWHRLYYIAFLPFFFFHRAVYFACYSKAKEQFNSMFVPNSNIVHICSAGSAGKCLQFQQQRPVCGRCWKCALNLRWYIPKTRSLLAPSWPCLQRNCFSVQHRNISKLLLTNLGCFFQLQCSGHVS